MQGQFRCWNAAEDVQPQEQDDARHRHVAEGTAPCHPPESDESDDRGHVQQRLIPRMLAPDKAQRKEHARGQHQSELELTMHVADSVLAGAWAACLALASTLTDA